MLYAIRGPRRVLSDYQYQVHFKARAKQAEQINLRFGDSASGGKGPESEKEVGLRQARKPHVLQQYARVRGHRRVDEHVVADLLHVPVAKRE